MVYLISTIHKNQSLSEGVQVVCWHQF